MCETLPKNFQLNYQRETTLCVVIDSTMEHEDLMSTRIANETMIYDSDRSLAVTHSQISQTIYQRLSIKRKNDPEVHRIDRSHRHI